jgi:hypothetical protein
VNRLVSLKRGKGIHAGNRQEAAVEGFLEVSIVRSNWVMNRDKICPRGEGTFDLELSEGRDHRGKHVSPAQHCLADGHELGDGVVAIANELEYIVCLVYIPTGYSL